MSTYCPEHYAFELVQPTGRPKPLKGIRVIDAGNLVAAPVTAGLLADFGAEVIKIEHPQNGDPLRALEPHRDGVSLWWKVTNRNKRVMTLNLSKPEGAEVFKDLVRTADVVTENFRPGVMERWGLGYEELKKVNPRIIMLRISGFGQYGPYKNRAGFGRVAGAMSGLANLIGEPDGPPMTPGYPIEDGIAGVFGAFAVMVALFHREVHGGEGQMIDLALTEAVLRLLENNPIQYDQLQTIPMRAGNRHEYVAPSSTYRTKDGKYITMAASTQKVWERLCRAMGREDLIHDPRFKDNKARVAHSLEVNGIVEEWIAAHTREEVERIFTEYQVAYAVVYDMKDVFNDPQYRARRTLVRVPDEELGEAVVQNVIPFFSDTPGEIRHLGPPKGAHTVEILQELGYSMERIEALRAKGVI